MRNETVVIRVYNGGGAELIAKFQYEGDAQEFINHYCRPEMEGERFGYLVRYNALTGDCHAQMPGDE